MSMYTPKAVHGLGPRHLKPARRPVDEHVHHHFLGLSAERVFQHNHLFNMLIRKKATHIAVSRLSPFVILQPLVLQPEASRVFQPFRFWSGL